MTSFIERLVLQRKTGASSAVAACLRLIGLAIVVIASLGVQSTYLLLHAQGTPSREARERTTVPQPAIIHRLSIMDRVGGETEVVISASAPFTATPFELLSPPRMVVDMPDVGFALPESPAELPGRLVQRYRFGELGAGRGRIVLDTRERTVVVSSRNQENGSTYELRLILRGHAAPRSPDPAQTARIPLPQLRPSQFSPRERREQRQSKTPVIVIDPGHGGTDPGAVTSDGGAEKTIALAVARQLAARLRKTNRFHVVMTRSTDTFVSLDDRIRISEDADADLFISLHADAVGDQSIASAVRGATVYTVSAQASDAVARALAEKENAADQKGGVSIGQAAQSEAVRSILFDLLRRESTNHAARFREHLISRLGKVIALSRSPRRAAAFKVLKQVKTPAVLIELGYMSNKTDQSLMQTRKWQARVAMALEAAIKLQFARR